MIADLVNLHSKPRRAHPGDNLVPAGAILVAESQAADTAFSGSADSAQRLDARHEARRIDVKIRHGAHA